MSHPNIIYGDFGDEKQTYSTKVTALGRLMILPDGRKFRFCKASATAMVAGDLYQQNALGILAGTADGGLLTGAAITAGGGAGSTTITMTTGATAKVSKDLFADGYLFISELAGQGHCYAIESHTATTATAAALVVTLKRNDKFKVAVSAATSTAGLRQNPYHNLLLTTANTVGTGPLAGIAPVAIEANYFGWIQRSGVCAALTDGTVIEGEPVTPSGVLAGAVAPHPTIATTATAFKGGMDIGICMNVSASTKYSLIDLMLE